MGNIVKTNTRKQFNNLDSLPRYDRSLVDYSKYSESIGHAGVKYSMAVQATRGCPYRCFYCDVYKTTLHHFRRSVDSVFEEVKALADLGIKRIEFIDDIFNVKAKDFVAFFNKVIQNNLKVKFFFPTALKGDLLNKEIIDVMMQGGAKCNAHLVNDTLKLDDGSKVQISKCPNNHGKIKSPLCCGQDMTCSVN